VSAAHSDAALQFGPPIAGWKSAIVREPLTIAAAGPHPPGRAAGCPVRSHTSPGGTGRWLSYAHGSPSRLRRARW
jgi:hypothetical protein